MALVLNRLSNRNLCIDCEFEKTCVIRRSHAKLKLVVDYCLKRVGRDEGWYGRNKVPSR